MAQVRVYNDNVHAFKQDWRDQKIEIPPKSFIMMEESEAYDFRGTYSPMMKDKHGQPDPKYFKMIRIEQGAVQSEVKVDPLVCMKCSYKSSSTKDLDEHINANHLDSLADQKLADERRAKKHER